MVPYCNVLLDTKDYVLMFTRAVSASVEDDLNILMGFLACGLAGWEGAKYSSRKGWLCPSRVMTITRLMVNT